jgi:uncharacterized membrane protein YwzB
MMQEQTMKLLYKLTLAGLSFLAPIQALAESPFERAQKMTGEVGTKAGIAEGGGLTQMLGNIINVFLGFLGIVFLVLMLYAGFMWMTAQGDEAKVKKAKDIIFQAIIGLIVIVAAYAISNFVLGSLLNSTRG